MIKFDSIFNSISGKEHVYCLKKMPLERMCNTVTIILYTYKSYIVLKKSFFFLNYCTSNKRSSHVQSYREKKKEMKSCTVPSLSHNLRIVVGDSGGCTVVKNNFPSRHERLEYPFVRIVLLEIVDRVTIIKSPDAVH